MHFYHPSLYIVFESSNNVERLNSVAKRLTISGQFNMLSKTKEALLVFSLWSIKTVSELVHQIFHFQYKLPKAK